jgi:undecaprenyl-diphosphatase
MKRYLATCCAAVGLVLPHWAMGGIDHKVAFDESGIWSRNNQKLVDAVVAGGVIVGALVEGSDSRLGRTAWQGVDSLIIGQASYLVLNEATGRLRPSETTDPSQWRKGGHSFPSGEVTAVSSAITPFVLEYGPQNPAAYALELLPLYQSVARVKSQAHWQTDVIAGWAIGTATGYYAHSRGQPFTVQVLPRAITIGWRKRF